MSVDPAVPHIALEVNGRDIDVAASRQALLKMAGDIGPLQNLFDILRDGLLSSIRYAVHGRTIDDLRKFENMIIQGSLSEGEVQVPAVDLNLSKVNGQVEIKDGVLNAEKVQGRYLNCHVHDGGLRLGLTGERKPFTLDLGLTADLGQLPELLRKVIKDQRVHDRLNQIRDLAGSATGRLILGDTLDDIRVAVELDSYQASGRIEGAPCPLDISGRKLNYQARRVEAHDLSVRLQNTSLKLPFVRCRWENEPFLQIFSAGADLDLHEIFTWLSSVGSLSRTLGRIQALSGKGILADSTLEGPLFKPGRWRFEIAGRIENAVVKSDQLPGPLTLKNGNFKATPEGLELERLRAGILDAALVVSGRLNQYRQGGKQPEPSIRRQGRGGGQSMVAGPNGISRLPDAASAPENFGWRFKLGTERLHKNCRAFEHPERFAAHSRCYP